MRFLGGNEKKVKMGKKWVSTRSRFPEAGRTVMCIVKNHRTGKREQVSLKKVHEDDVDWRDEDGDEISYDWSVTHWQEKR